MRSAAPAIRPVGAHSAPEIVMLDTLSADVRIAGVARCADGSPAPGPEVAC